MVSSHVLMGLQTLVSRSVDVRDPLLISFGIIEGGNQFNVLADRVRLTGMMRCLSPEVRRSAPHRIEELVRGITSAFGATHMLQITPGAPVTMNHPDLLQRSLSLLETTWEKTTCSCRGHRWEPKTLPILPGRSLGSIFCWVSVTKVAASRDAAHSQV